MDEILAAFVGPIAPWLTTFSFAAVVVMRKSIRKPHVIALVLITVLALLAFFSVILLGLAGWRIPPLLFDWVLRLLGILVLVCGPAVGFWTILRVLGFVPDETVVVLPRTRLPRAPR